MSTASPPLPRHGPYPPTIATLGGSPTKTLDDPILAVFVLLFVLGAVIHMTILQINRRRGKKFLMSGMLFGFCMARITACVMRIVWSTRVTDIPVAIAAQIFVAAGVLLLFIVNLIFAQRIVRAQHPEFGWTKWFSWVFKIYYASIVAMLAALITATVQSFYVRSPTIHDIDRKIQLVGQVYFTVAAFLPIILIALDVIIPKKTRVDKFGAGRFRTKIWIIIFSSVLLTLGAAFRAGVGFLPKPLAHPAWYHSKACFYLFDFTIEITVVYLYAIIRVDKRFHIPDGSHAPGHYSNGVNGIERKHSFADRVMTEERVFDGDEHEDEEPSNEGTERKPQRDEEATIGDSPSATPAQAH